MSANVGPTGHWHSQPDAYLANLAEMETGRLAELDGGSKAIRSAGAVLVRDHKALDSKLIPVAEALKVRLPLNSARQDVRPTAPAPTLAAPIAATAARGPGPMIRAVQRRGSPRRRRRHAACSGRPWACCSICSSDLPLVSGTRSQMKPVATMPTNA